jgi:RNA polymerase sigma-70 factor (ECF subfamily)
VKNNDTVAFVSASRPHQEVVRAATGGDDEALAALVRLYHDRVYRFGLRVCRDGADADDAVQEAFAKLAFRSDVIRDRGSLSWLLTVVRNLCLRMLGPLLRERRALGERVDAEEVPSQQLDPDVALERWELVRAVHAAIAGLDEPYRQVLVLRDIEGCSGAATCSALGLPLGVMKTRLHRGRAMLRAALARPRHLEGR